MERIVQQSRLFLSRRKLFNKTSEIRDGWLFILPAMVIMTLFVVWPIIHLVWMSMNQYRFVEGVQTSEFIGLKNFFASLDDPLFLKTLWTSFYFPLVVTPIQTILSLFVAVLLSNKIRWVGLFRTVYFIPVVMSFVVVGMFWKEMLNTNFGVMNEWLSGLGLPRQQFLTDPDTARFSIAMISIWKSFGWYLIIFVAALTQIPKTLYDAGNIDGTNAWQRFWHITLPLIRKTMLFVVIISTMNCIKLFTPIMVMTDGGPANSTKTIVHYIYTMAFRMGNFGNAAAMAIMLFFIILCISFIQFRLMKEEE